MRGGGRKAALEALDRGISATRETTPEPNPHRTPSRESGSSRLARVREAAKQNGKLKVTALLHQAAGQRVMESVVRFLEQKLRLRVNREKSAVAPVGERKFLGYQVLWNGKLWIAPKSLDRAKERIRQITRRSRGVSLAPVIVELNRFLVGWLTHTAMRPVVDRGLKP